MMRFLRYNKLKVYIILVIIMALFNFYYRPISINPLITKEYKKSSSYVNNLYYSDEMFKKSMLSKSDYYIYEQMVNDLKNGKYKSKIECRIPGCSFEVGLARDTIMLDHPELLSFQSTAYRDYNTYIVVEHRRLDPVRSYLGTKRILREVDIVKKETKSMSDKEKILFVYNYVASHNYDRLFRYSSSNQSAYSFFTKGSSVCAGFAKASQIIFQNIGIKSYLVTGYEHMWNYVEYEGKYYVFDATVGASYRDKTNSHYYDGLGRTTVNKTIGEYSSLYPKIETVTLKELFGV